MVNYTEVCTKVENFCISCISTLELGIDIGNVDEVVQIDARHSIASLIQRVGRSGSRIGKSSNLYLYSTDRWSLLQSLACWLLYSEQYIEPIQIIEKPYNVLVHQILSVVKGSSGLYLNELLPKIAANSTFSNINEDEVKEITGHLQEIDFLEKSGHEYIIGVEGEKIVNHKYFYSMFHTPTVFKVSSQGVKIGELPLSPQIKEDENIFLSAKIWKIKYVDYEMNKIEVIRTNDGKKPIFLGDGADTAHKIRNKMLEVLFSNVKYEFMDETGQLILYDMRSEFAVFPLNNFEFQRPLKNSNNNLELFSFAGSKINKSIGFIYNYLGIEHQYFDHTSSFTFKQNTDIESVYEIISYSLSDVQINDIIRKHLELNPKLINVSKWGTYLPIEFQVEILKNKEYDFEGCFKFLQNINFIENV